MGASIYDLTDARVRDRLRVPPSALVNPWKQIVFVQHRTPPSWGRTDILSRHVDGVLVPSVMRTGGVNLVLWRWNAGANSVSFHDPKGDLGPIRA